ncbi:COG3650 family protein [Solitalea lacus]|uniref:COG3650 family protein n=1 Tax=Solitalea lacus TaxID=2911172 RepID=UPI001EDC6615|nr:hypothetical protein [Solitalea lacus]UKJ07042.1 hypothetical protein L2B55_16120 [Solitalea lacus]
MTKKSMIRSLQLVFAFSLGAISILSCKGGKNNQNTMGADTVLVKGLYIHSDKIDSLRDCADTTVVYFVKDQTGKLGTRYDSLPGIQHTNEAVLVELKGVVVKTTNDSTAKTLPRTLNVYSINRIERKNFQNVCIQYDFWALGSEPNWNLQISQSENLISFEDFNTQKGYRFNYKTPRINSDTTSWTYESRNREERSNIRVIIRKQDCNDTMSDHVYKYSAEVSINGRNYKGCAVAWK